MGNSDGGDTTMLLVVVGGICCCCMMSSAGLGGSYFFLPDFKKWVNNLFGMGGGDGPFLSGKRGKGCLDTWAVTKTANSPVNNNCTKNKKTSGGANLWDIKDLDGVWRGCGGDGKGGNTTWNNEGTLCCFSDEPDRRCLVPGTAFAAPV